MLSREVLSRSARQSTHSLKMFHAASDHDNEANTIKFGDETDVTIDLG